jgi:hypothetical protein
MGMSAYSPRWRRFLQRRVPWLFKRCPVGNYHWRWDRFCYCRARCHTVAWHGGILDFKTGKEIREDHVCGL